MLERFRELAYADRRGRFWSQIWATAAYEQPRWLPPRSTKFPPYATVTCPCGHPHFDARTWNHLIEQVPLPDARRRASLRAAEKRTWAALRAAAKAAGPAGGSNSAGRYRQNCVARDPFASSRRPAPVVRVHVEFLESSTRSVPPLRWPVGTDWRREQCHRARVPHRARVTALLTVPPALAQADDSIGQFIGIASRKSAEAINNDSDLRGDIRVRSIGFDQSSARSAVDLDRA